MRAFYAKLDKWESGLAGKEVTIPTDLTAGILFFLLGAAILLVMPGQVTISESDPVNGRIFPRLLMILMMCCSAVLVVRELMKKAKGQPMTTRTVSLLVEAKALIILGILLATFFLCSVTGLFVVGAVFCSVAFLIFFHCEKRSYFIITVAAAVIIWAAFRFLLNVNF